MSSLSCAARARALVQAHLCQRADNVLFWPAVTLPSFSLRHPPRRRRSPSPPRSAALPVAAAPRRRQGQLPSPSPPLPISAKVSCPPRRRRSPSPPSRSAGPPVAAASHAVRPKMTPRFRRLPAMTRGQAPRPGVVEDRSSCADHHYRIRSMKTVSSLYHFPLKNSGEISPRFPRNLTLLPAGQTGASAPRTSE